MNEHNGGGPGHAIAGHDVTETAFMTSLSSSYWLNEQEEAVVGQHGATKISLTNVMLPLDETKAFERRNHAGCANPEKVLEHGLPVSRVRRIVKNYACYGSESPDLSAELGPVMASATAAFIGLISRVAYTKVMLMEKGKRRTVLQKADLVAACALSDKFDFLIDVLYPPVNVNGIRAFCQIACATCDTTHSNAPLAGLE